MADETGRACMLCRFWDCQFRRHSDFTVAQCRRHSPIGSKPPSGSYADPRWPLTQGQEWCGDFERTIVTIPEDEDDDDDEYLDMKK